MSNNYSDTLRNTLDACRAIAVRQNSEYVTPEHLILALLADDTSKAFKTVDNVAHGLGARELRDALERSMLDEALQRQPLPGLTPDTVLATDNVRRIIKLAVLEARMMRSILVYPEHLLLAVFHNSESLSSPHLAPFLHAGVDYKSLSARLKPEQTRSAAPEYEDDEDDEGDDAPKSPRGSSPAGGAKQQPRTETPKGGDGAGDTPLLDKFGNDMTAAAELGRLDPVVGRETEIERVAQILSRRKKNNPVLIGEPGVGKNAISEGLALRIVKRQVPRTLIGKRLVSLDMASIVAGTKYRGQFEERIKGILNELSKNKDIILFIDEIHTIVGAGNATGQMDAANLLKPALSRGEIQCIGATTLDEYRKNIEKDAALERRFQKVMVEPTTAEQTRIILDNIKESYEEHHNITFTPEALDACVTLTERYITDRNFPDKAIDALDEAASRVHIITVEVPAEIEQLERDVATAAEQKLEAARAQDFETAAAHRDREQQLKQQLSDAKALWEKELDAHRQVVDEERVAEVVAMMTGVPVQRVAQAEGIRLREMMPVLQSKIIGQDPAIEKIVKAIRRNRLGLKDPNKPIGTFMFLGPTGVGKTHLAKRLAEYLFDSADTLIRIDMSEYMEKFSVSRLVGAPPGYVGYEEGGQLTEKVRRHPYSVVLLDEIEKAHPDVFNLLLQVMDEGHLTDSLGRRIDFRNTIIIMTSNIGSRQLKDFGAGIGFTPAGVTDQGHSQAVIRKALNKAFSPEFLNRVDDIVMFEPLTRESIFRIIDIELAGFYRRIGNLGYTMTLTDAARTFVAEKGYDPQYGARPLKRAIQKYLEDEMAEQIIAAELAPGDELLVDHREGDDRLTATVVKKDAPQQLQS